MLNILHHFQHCLISSACGQLYRAIAFMFVAICQKEAKMQSKESLSHHALFGINDFTKLFTFKYLSLSFC